MVNEVCPQFGKYIIKVFKNLTTLKKSPSFT